MCESFIFILTLYIAWQPFPISDSLILPMSWDKEFLFRRHIRRIPVLTHG